MNGDALIKKRYAKTDPVKQVTILDVQWSNIPLDVKEDVVKFWQDMELGNDYFYYKIEASDEELAEKYPLLIAYLKKRDVEKCLLHYWW